ncbi:RnaseH-domain-containing protein, partial [Suillus brevipes Sb2]
NAKCGSGIWFGRDNPQNKVLSISGPNQSNQVGEIAAVLAGIQLINPQTPAIIITDSRFVIDGLTKHLHDWEDKGWIGIANSDLIRATAYNLRIRSASTTFKWVKGHDQSRGNIEADKLAGLGALKDNFDQLDTEIPSKFNLQGARLTQITQALAYQGIMSLKTIEHKRNTIGLLDMTRYAIQSISTELETDHAIWNSRKNKDLSKKFQSFLYRALNDSYKVGKFWSNIPQFEHRADCTSCKEDIESIEHILTDCPRSPSKTIWKLAKSLWPTDIIQWPQISIGLILGCGAINIPHQHNEEDQQDKNKAEIKRGLSRLLRIIISESAYLIWILRCERVIQGQQHDDEIITKRWINTLNRRLHIDRIIASKTKRSKKAITKVQATWEKVVSKNKNLPKKWVTTLEVLVGITLPRPPQHEAT